MSPVQTSTWLWRVNGARGRVEARTVHDWIRRHRPVPILAALLLLVCVAPVSRYAHAASVDIPVGALPSGIAVNARTGLVYVANEGDGTLSVIAAASNRVVGGVSLIDTLALGGSASPMGVAVDEGTNTIYVAETGAAKVALVDGATGTVRTTAAVAPGPWGVAVNPQTHQVYVTSLAGSVSVLDGASGAVTSVIDDARLQRPAGIAVNARTNQVYVANLAGDSVAVIDGTSNAVTGAIPVGSRPTAVAVDPSGGLVYAANFGGATLSVLDPATNSVVMTRSVGVGPLAVAVDPVPGVVYVAATDNSITMLDRNGRSLGVLADGAVSGPQGLGLYDGTSSLYVSSGATNAVVAAPLAPATPAPAQ